MSKNLLKTIGSPVRLWREPHVGKRKFLFDIASCTHMSSNELRDYIQQSRSRGLPDANIQHELESAGWNPEDVLAALRSTEGSMQAPRSHNKRKLIAWGTVGRGLLVIVIVVAGQFLMKNRTVEPSAPAVNKQTPQPTLLC